MRGPELKGPGADGMWENEFGLRGLIYYSKIGAVRHLFGCSDSSVGIRGYQEGGSRFQ